MLPWWWVAIGFVIGFLLGLLFCLGPSSRPVRPSSRGGEDGE